MNVSREREKSAKLEERVCSLLALRQHFEQTKTPHERTLLERQISATDCEIDRLVYELYGLTEKEIRIVEEIHQI